MLQADLDGVADPLEELTAAKEAISGAKAVL